MSLRGFGDGELDAVAVGDRPARRDHALRSVSCWSLAALRRAPPRTTPRYAVRPPPARAGRRRVRRSRPMRCWRAVTGSSRRARFSARRGPSSAPGAASPRIPSAPALRSRRPFRRRPRWRLRRFRRGPLRATAARRRSSALLLRCPSRRRSCVGRGLPRRRWRLLRRPLLLPPACGLRRCRAGGRAQRGGGVFGVGARPRLQEAQRARRHERHAELCRRSPRRVRRRPFRSFRC